MVRRGEGVRESVEQVRLGPPVPQILPHRSALEFLSLGQEVVDIFAILSFHSLVVGRPVNDDQ